MHALSNRFQSFRPVIHRIHRRHHREQHLRGADIARRFFAADVLLARLQCESIRRLAVRINRHPCEPTGKIPLVRIARGHIRRVRAAKTHRHPKALRSADHDVCTPFAWRFQQHERERISGANEQRAFRMRRIGIRCHIVNLSAGGRILREHREVIAFFHEFRREAYFHFNTQRFCACFYAFNGLRMTITGDDEYVAG